MNDPEYEKAVAEFVGAFEVVSRYDWDYSSVMMDVMSVGKEGATFLEPGLEDESDDWGARGALLEKYRALVAVMKKRKMEPQFPFPLDRLPDFKGRVW